MVFLKFRFVWDVTLHHWLIGIGHLETGSRSRVQESKRPVENCCHILEE
jgi:hypothetical protein